MDMLFFEGLAVPCRVGCTAQERAQPQALRVDVQLFGSSLAQAARSDQLSETIDYRMALDMVAAVQGREYLLIERVAEELAAVGLAHPRVEKIQVTVRKRPPVQGLEVVGFQIVRSRPGQT